MDNKAFEPGGATVNIDVSSSSQSVAFGTDPVDQVRVMNNGTATAWIKFGNSSGTVTATTAAGIPIGPGAAEVFTTPANADTVAVIAAGSTGKIYFTPGAGL
jgi:hypothetical protein